MLQLEWALKDKRSHGIFGVLFNGVMIFRVLINGPRLLGGTLLRCRDFLASQPTARCNGVMTLGMTVEYQPRVMTHSK